MLINENVIRSFIRSLLFETNEKIDLKEIFQPDPHHSTTPGYKKGVASKYTIYDTQVPMIGKEEDQNSNSEENNVPIIPDDEIENKTLYSQICKIKNDAINSQR